MVIIGRKRESRGLATDEIVNHSFGLRNLLAEVPSSCRVRVNGVVFSDSSIITVYFCC